MPQPDLGLTLLETHFPSHPASTCRSLTPSPCRQFCGEDERPDAAGSSGGSSCGGIIYADLQLPRASNNGSMRKLRQARRPGRPESAAPAASQPATEYAVIQFTAPEAGPAAERTDV